MNIEMNIDEPTGENGQRANICLHFSWFFFGLVLLFLIFDHFDFFLFIYKIYRTEVYSY